MKKAATIRGGGKMANPINNTTLPTDNAVSILVDLDQITPSQTESQIYRRRSFGTKTGIAALNELAATIGGQGLLQAVTVRPLDDAYELVLGERRFIAHGPEHLNRGQIRAEIREMTDIEVIEAQLAENIERQAPSPMEEAFGIDDLIKKGATYEEAATKLGISPRLAHERRKLVDLDGSFMDMLEQEKLPIAHAMLLAKLAPDTQVWLFKNKEGKVFDWQSKVRSFTDLRSLINREILMNLASFPFGLERKDLRDDGLACTECPQRTSRQVELFADEEKADQDRCLDKICHGNKLKKFVKITRTEIAADAGDKKIKAPLIGKDSYYYGSSDGGGKFAGETLLRSNMYKLIAKKEKPCDKAETAIWGDGPNRGKKSTICRDPKCKTHKTAVSPSSSRSQAQPHVSNAEKEKKFDAEVAFKVRLRLLSELSLKFTAANPIMPAGEFSDRALERLWIIEESAGDIDGDIKSIMFGDTEDDDSASRKMLGVGSGFNSKSKDYVFGIEKLTEDQKQQLWFLLLFAWQGKTYYGETCDSTETLRWMAESNGVNFLLIDAEERFGHLTDEKQKAEFQQSYVDAIRKGKKNVPMPRFFDKSYKPKKDRPNDESPFWPPWGGVKAPKKTQKAVNSKSTSVS